MTNNQDLTFLAKEWLQDNLCSFNDEPLEVWLQFYIDDAEAETNEEVAAKIFHEWKTYSESDMAKYLADRSHRIDWNEIGSWLMTNYNLNFYIEDDYKPLVLKTNWE